MDWKIFSVLMWKHWCVRKRKIIFTLLEYLLPLVLFVLLFVFKSNIVTISSSANADFLAIQRPEAIKISETPAPRLVLFTPDTNFTRYLMKSVGDKLNLNQIEYFPGEHIKGYYPFNDTFEIVNFTMSKDMRDDDAVVIFQTEGVRYPKNLKYTIRMKRNFMTQIDTSVDGQLVPHENFGRIYEPFMRLQWAIDTSYLELQTGKPVQLEVTLQEFPFAMRVTSASVELVMMLLNFCFFFSLILTFTFLVTRLLEERTNGVQELMKMSGVSTAMLSLAHFLDTLPGMLTFSVGGAVFLTIGEPALLTNTDPIALFVCLLLHSCTIVAFGFVCAYILRSMEYANTVTVTIFAALSILSDALLAHAPALVRPLLGAVPGLPVKWLLREMEALGKYGTGLTFRTMLTSHDSRTPTVAYGLICMVVQTVLLMLFAWYLDHVCPGKLGLARPWNFLCQKQYWRKNDIVPTASQSDSEQETSMAREERYFEPAPAHADVGIKVVGVTKVFPNHRALNNVSLDVYKGELTVLLGHNGAGKTTLMSIMTGTLNPSAGQVFVNGQDIMSSADVRRQIGFCPQHNLCYPQLTVIEHVVLFSMLRGQTRDVAWKSSRLLLDRLGLEAVSGQLCRALSGGMQRRLQMACALAGDAAVVVLDEPSAGLDVETRRSLWDLVLGLRGRRTVLVSTHFMEEADALGDRVAALHQGQLRCHATPMYLKKAIGTGYRLTFTTIGPPKEAAISAVVREFVPDATVKQVTLNSVSFALPAASSSAFASMFASLESRRSSLGIDSIGVGVSTLEEVFLQLCSDIDTTTSGQDEVDGVSQEEPYYEKTRGLRLHWIQFFELMKRQLYYIWHKKYSFLIWQVFVSLALIVVLGTQLVNPSSTVATNATARLLDVGSYDPDSGYKVLYRAGPDARVRAFSDNYPTVSFERADDVAEDVLQTGIKDVMEYHKYLAGIEINETDAKVMYTTTVRHAAPAALSLLANVLGAALASPLGGVQGSAPRLAVINDPLAADRPLTPPLTVHMPKMDFLVHMFTFFIGSILLFNLLNAAHLPVLERISGARSLHVAAGCAPELHWAATLVFRVLLTLPTFTIPVLIICAFDVDDTIDEPVFLMSLLMSLTLGSLAFLAFVFLITFCFGHTGTNTFLSLCIFVNCVFYFIGSVSETGVLGALSQVSLHALPAHATLSALGASAARAHGNAHCALNRHLCPAPVLPAPCCETTSNMQCLFCLGSEDSKAPGYYMLVLLVQFIFYMSLVFAVQRGVVAKLRETLKARVYVPPPHRYNDEMVRAERAYVSKAIDLPPSQISDVMLVSDLHKVHNTCWNRFTAIRGISFSVKKGECLGLLGVNGAGKSTAFRALTAADWPTRGRTFAAGRHREGYGTEYMRGMGYCPQFFGLDSFLTGRQNLRLILTLRGLAERDARDETDSWIKIVGLEKYIDRKVEGYSGGCQRRLAAGAALAAGAPLTLLDEPTAGVDVSARRRVWAALRRGLAHQRAVIISSHSMDEMEALCHRIAIMSRGELCALGAPAALRAAHAAGHAVVLKLRPAPAGTPAGTPRDETDAPSSDLHRLKGTLVKKFNCTLKDEHKTMLHYHINETLPYSQIFEEMEQLKSAFPDYVEDYSVTETTLEEVFLSFARDAEPDPRSNTPEPTPRPV